MNIPEPQHNPVIIGHDTAMAQIVDAFKSNRMPQAWLIHGIEGIGKATFAYHAANFVLSDGKNTPGKLNMENASARLIAAESHPDLFVLRRPTDEKTGKVKDSIPADNARKVAPFLHMTATQGNWRVAIIDEAHTLNRFGQNSILKVIEEPPARCLILITATTPGTLLPTVRSRCRILPLQPLVPIAMQTILARLGADESLDEECISRIVQLSGGSVGFALKMLATESLPLYDEMLTILGAMPTLDVEKLHALADRISRRADADSFDVITRLLIDKLRINAKNAALDPSLKANTGQLDRTVQLWEKVRQVFAMAEQSNLDKKLAFINAMMEIRRATA